MTPNTALASEEQVLESVQAAAIKKVFDEYCDKVGFDQIAGIFGKGVTVEVGDMLGFPAEAYDDLLRWSDDLIRASTADPDSRRAIRRRTANATSEPATAQVDSTTIISSRRHDSPISRATAASGRKTERSNSPGARTFW